jgi:hypothetical protein
MPRRLALLPFLGAVCACSSPPVSSGADSGVTTMTPARRDGGAARDAHHDAPDASLRDASTGAADALHHSPDARGADAAVRDAIVSHGVDSGAADAADAAHDAVALGSDSATDADASSLFGPLSAGYVDYDVNHILITGQSNAVSNAGAPALSLSQPFTNLMFDTGVMHVSSCDGIGCTGYGTPHTLVPLVDGDSFFDFPTETASSGAANEISFLARETFGFGTHAGYPTRHDVLVTLNGRSGNTYYCLRKGGCAYQAADYIEAFTQGLMDVQNAMSLATAAGLTYVVRGVLVIHGESDHYDYTSGFSEFPLGGTDGVANEIQDYGQGLIEWQRDYQTSIQAITGQTEPVPLFVSGLSGWTDVTASLIPTYQLQAHVNAPGKVILVTPGYPMQVYMDCEHYNDYGERRVGEYFAKAYAQVVLAGRPWEPVRPRTITRAGAVVTVDYFVPTPPLVIDTTRVAAAPSYGFDFIDSGTEAPIASVALTGPETVTITLAAPPSGTNMTLRYAQNEPPTPTGCIGPGTVYARSASGNLRDSDMTPSFYSDANSVPYDMFDWGVIFELPVQ